MKFEDGSFKKLNISTSNMFLINTGRPVVTTGECVSKVKKYFVNDSKIGYEFSDLTLNLEKELSSNNINEIIMLMRENHKLLDYIGVVPARVNNYINQVHSLGAAAKICGAGAVSGDTAGAVLAVCPEQDQESMVSLNKLSQEYGFTMQAVKLDGHGIRVV